MISESCPGTSGHTGPKPLGKEVSGQHILVAFHDLHHHQDTKMKAIFELVKGP